jgi:phosphoglycerate dehydrogenase-like enzyme
MSRLVPRGPSDLVVFSETPCPVARIRERFPSVEVVDISKGVPPDKCGDVLFGGLGARSVDAMAAGVRWVQLIATGLDKVPAEVRAAPVLTTARVASAVAIGEYVIAAMGAFARNFPANWLREAPENWYLQEASSLAGATLGLYGFGGIAQRVARIAQAMDMRVMALRRHPEPSPVEGVEMAGSLPGLLEAADHLVLAAPATDATRHAINADSLRLLRPGVHLVNIARGSLVDHDALRTALDDGRVARASLDVTDPEPLPDGHWLYTHPRVFLTPHASWAGQPQFGASTELFCDNLERFLSGEPLHGIVGPDGY